MGKKAMSCATISELQEEVASLEKENSELRGDLEIQAASRNKLVVDQTELKATLAIQLERKLLLEKEKHVLSVELDTVRQQFAGLLAVLHVYLKATRNEHYTPLRGELKQAYFYAGGINYAE